MSPGWKDTVFGVEDDGARSGGLPTWDSHKLPRSWSEGPLKPGYAANPDGTFSPVNPLNRSKTMGPAEKPAGWKVTDDGKIQPVNQYGQPYAAPQAMRPPGDLNDYYYDPTNNTLTRLGGDGSRMILSQHGGEPRYLGADGLPITEKDYLAARSTSVPADTGDPSQYGAVTDDRLNKLISFRDAQGDIVAQLGAMKATLNSGGTGAGMDAARRTLEGLYRSASATKDALDRLVKAQTEFKRTVDTFWDKHREVTVRKTVAKNKVVAASGMSGVAPSTSAVAAASAHEELRAVLDEEKKIIQEFVSAQPPIRSRAQVPIIEGMHLAPGGGPQGAGPTGVNGSPNGVQSDLGDTGAPVGVVPTRATPSSTTTRATNDIGDLADSAVPGTLGQQQGQPQISPMATMAMPAYGTQAGTGVGGPSGGPRALSDDEFNELLNNARGQGTDDSPFSPSNAPTFAATAPSTATPSPLPWLNNATVGTGESGATNTASGPKTVSAAPTSSTARSTPPMMMPPMMPGAGAGAGGQQNQNGKSERPKIANANPAEIYGDEQIKHTDPIITPKPASRD